MQKIKVLTDSACDISVEDEKKYGIEIMNIPITVGDKGYRERVDFTNEEFYEIMDNYDGIPATSQVNTFEQLEIYKKIYEEGYSDILQITISSTGSNIYNSALMAKEKFFEEIPEAKDKFNITVIDSRNYTGVYGYPVVQAAAKLEKGTSLKEVIAYLNDWFSSASVIFAPYNLKYAKKSGRISSMAAFVGEVLGLKAIIRIADGVSENIAKVRGEKAIIPKIVEIACEEMIPQTPYGIMTGSTRTESEELAKIMTKKVGYPPVGFYQVGAAVASNAGHAVVGVIVKGQNRIK